MRKEQAQSQGFSTLLLLIYQLSLYIRHTIGINLHTYTTNTHRFLLFTSLNFYPRYYFLLFLPSLPPVARSPPPIPRSQFLLLLTQNDCIHFLIFPSYCLLFFPSFSRNVSFSFLFVPFTFTATLIASSAAQMNISNEKRTKQIFLNEIGYAGLPTTAH